MPLAAKPGANSSELSAKARKMLDAFCGMNLRYMETALTEMAAQSEAYQTTCRITSYRKGLIIIFTTSIRPAFCQ